MSFLTIVSFKYNSASSAVILSDRKASCTKQSNFLHETSKSLRAVMHLNLFLLDVSVRSENHLVSVGI
jgi:hypothetical protein